jgi:hypothetical protein
MYSVSHFPNASLLFAHLAEDNVILMLIMFEKLVTLNRYKNLILVKNHLFSLLYYNSPFHCPSTN